MSKKLRYSEFEQLIDLEQLYEAIGFEVLRENGAWDQGYCVFPDNHANGDQTGKFGINRDERIYNCWVCGGGDLLSLTMELNPTFNVDEATHWLHQFTRGISEDKFLDEFEKDLVDVERRVATLPYFNDRVLDKWLAQLDINDNALDTLAMKWGISAEEAWDHKVGYDPEHSRMVGGEVYIGPALIFPVFWKERLVGWQERWLEDDRPKWVPKYTNTTDLPRNEIIYGYDDALRGPLRKARVFVVESVPSKIALASAGLNAVATFGSSLHEAQLRLLRRFSQGVLLCPDNDPPRKPREVPTGLKWQKSLADYLVNFIPVTLMPPPKTTNPKGDVADLLTQKPHDFIDWLLSAYDPLDDPQSDT